LVLAKGTGEGRGAADGEVTYIHPLPGAALKLSVDSNPDDMLPWEAALRELAPVDSIQWFGETEQTEED
jgi:hypothetical protein